MTPHRTDNLDLIGNTNRTRGTVLLALSLAAMLGSFLPATPAGAGNLADAFVSSTGSGTACTEQAPCATFDAAINAVGTGGVIQCIDAGDFGFLGITKSLTVDCTAALTGVTNAGASALGANVDAGNGTVILRGLSFNAVGTGSAGIRFENGNALHVENCRIVGNTAAPDGFGIEFFLPAGVSGTLYVSDTVIQDNGSTSPNGGAGIRVKTLGSESPRVVLNRVLLTNNVFGIWVDGIAAFTGSGKSPVSITVDHSASIMNGGTGILSSGSGAYIILGNSTVMSNNFGLAANSGGTIFSYQNNQLTGNFSDGAPTAFLTVK